MAVRLQFTDENTARNGESCRVCAGLIQFGKLAHSYYVNDSKTELVLSVTIYIVAKWTIGAFLPAPLGCKPSALVNELIAPNGSRSESSTHA